jgi:hypothetical protein
MIQANRYYDDFLTYYDKAKVLQNECNLGGKPYIGMVGDDLMEQVTIYDTVERRYAGFSNMLQDVWLGSSNPKFFKQEPWMKERTMSYDKLQDKWSVEVWCYVFFVHRVTGSGASFESDHGYRNTFIPRLAQLDTIEEMAEAFAKSEVPMFTSIGNQIPPFPKPQGSFKTGGKYYVSTLAPKLIRDLLCFIQDGVITIGEPRPIREVVDYMCEWHRARKINSFHFVFTAFAADLADYMPHMVDPKSHMYYGKNAKEAMELMATKVKGTKDQFYDAVMAQAVLDTKGDPRDLEDVMCDFIRYQENYIPDNREKTYAHLDRTKVWNNSAIKDHPKGRQRHDIVALS